MFVGEDVVKRLGSGDEGGDEEVGGVEMRGGCLKYFVGW